jgi:PilZ domain
MGIEIMLPAHGYSCSRRWARYKVDVPVSITLRRFGKVTVLEGRGSDLSCGGMTIFLPTDLHIGDQVTVEFTPPYSSQPVVMRGIVRNCHIYSYGVEFIKDRDAA